MMALRENLTRRLFLSSRHNWSEREKLDVGHHHPLGLQQQVAHILTAATIDQYSDVSMTASSAPNRTLVRSSWRSMGVLEHVSALAFPSIPKARLQLIHLLIQIVSMGRDAVVA